jgi:hypothetical protein
MVSFRSSGGGDDGPLEGVEAGVCGGCKILVGCLVIVVEDQTICHIQSWKCSCFSLDVWKPSTGTLSPASPALIPSPNTDLVEINGNPSRSTHLSFHNSRLKAPDRMTAD